MNKTVKNVMVANKKLYDKEYEKLEELFSTYNMTMRQKETNEYLSKVSVVARQQKFDMNTKFVEMTILYQPLIFNNVEIIGFKEQTNEDTLNIVFIDDIYKNIMTPEDIQLLNTEKMVCSHCNKRFSRKFMFITYNKSTKRLGFLSIPCFEEAFPNYTTYRQIIARMNYFINTNYEQLQGLKSGKVHHYIEYQPFVESALFQLEQGNILSEKVVKSLEYQDMVSPTSLFNEFVSYIPNSDANARFKEIFTNKQGKSSFSHTYKFELAEQISKFYNQYNSDVEPIAIEDYELKKEILFENITFVDESYSGKTSIYIYNFKDSSQNIITYLSKKELNEELSIGNNLTFKATPYKINEFRNVKSLQINKIKDIVIN